MKLYKDGVELCKAVKLSQHYVKPQADRPQSREIRWVLGVDAIITPPGLNEVPKPVYEFEDTIKKRRVFILSSSTPDAPQITVSL